MLILMPVILLLIGCSSQPILPTGDDVTVRREAPDSDCRPLGAVEGKVLSSTGTKEEALADMKSDAATKGANYVQIETQSAMGTAVRGQAFICD